MNEDRVEEFRAWFAALLTDGEALARAKAECAARRALRSQRVRWLAEAIEWGDLPAADVRLLRDAITCYTYDRQHEQFAEGHRHALNTTQGLHLSADDYDERMARRYGPMGQPPESDAPYAVWARYRRECALVERAEGGAPDGNT